jgi:hypothetical protein
LKESADKQRAEVLKAASAAVSIETVMALLTIVATKSVQSQQSTSSVVTVVAAAATHLMAGQIFHDFLISTHSKKLPIHESMEKEQGHEYTMNFQVKDTISVVPFNRGTWNGWTRVIKQHKCYAINGLRELPQIHLYFSLNIAKLVWTL